MALSGKWIISGSSKGEIKVWDSEKGTTTRVFTSHKGGIRSIAISKGGKLVASGGTDKVIHLWDPADGKLRSTLKGHKFAIRSLLFDPTESFLYSASDDMSIRKWELTGGTSSYVLKGHRNMVTGLILNKKTLLSGAFDATLRTWDSSKGELIRKDSFTAGPIQSMLLHPDGKSLFLGIRTGQIIQIRL